MTKLPISTNINDDRFILTTKDPITDLYMFKERRTLLLHTDFFHQDIANNYPMMMRMKLRVIFSF